MRKRWLGVKYGLRLSGIFREARGQYLGRVPGEPCTQLGLLALATQAEVDGWSGVGHLSLLSRKLPKMS